MTKKLGGKKFFRWLGRIDAVASGVLRNGKKGAWSEWAILEYSSSFYHQHGINMRAAKFNKQVKLIRSDWQEPKGSRIDLTGYPLSAKYIGDDANIAQGLTAQIDGFNESMKELKPVNQSARLKNKLNETSEAK